MTYPEWAPGRAHLAITKFIGFLLLRDRKPAEPRPYAVLTIQAGQNTAEANAVGLVYVGLITAGLFAWMSACTRVTPLRVVLLALPMTALALLVVHIGFAIFGLLLIGSHRVGLFRGRANHEMQSTAFHATFIALAVLAVLTGTLKPLGIAWLAVVAFEWILRAFSIGMKGRFDEIDSWFRSDL